MVDICFEENNELIEVKLIYFYYQLLKEMDNLTLELLVIYISMLYII